MEREKSRQRVNWEFEAPSLSLDLGFCFLGGGKKLLSQAVFEANYSRKLSSLKHRLVVMPASMRSRGGGGGSGAAGGGAGAHNNNGNASAENSVGATNAAGGTAASGGADNDEDGSTAAAAQAAAAPATQQQQQQQQQSQRQRSLVPTPSPSPAAPPVPRALPHLLAFPGDGGGGGGHGGDPGAGGVGSVGGGPGLNGLCGTSASLRAPSVLYWSWAFEAPHNVKIVVRRRLGDDRAPQGEFVSFFPPSLARFLFLFSFRNFSKGKKTGVGKNSLSSLSRALPFFHSRTPPPRAPPDRLQRHGGPRGPQGHQALRDARESAGFLDVLAAAALRLVGDGRRGGGRGLGGGRGEGGVRRRRRRRRRGPADAG